LYAPPAEDDLRRAGQHVRGNLAFPLLGIQPAAQGELEAADAVDVNGSNATSSSIQNVSAKPFARASVASWFRPWSMAE
jgi:hypothetical protein